MALGFGLLRLSPQAFWAMTPIELERALRAAGAVRSAPPDRSALTALMRAFPDRSPAGG